MLPSSTGRDWLLLVRIRASHGRTYWLAADSIATRAFGPQIHREDAIERFDRESGRPHALAEVVARHHSLSEARALIAKRRDARCDDCVRHE